MRPGDLIIRRNEPYGIEVVEKVSEDGRMAYCWLAYQDSISNSLYRNSQYNRELYAARITNYKPVEPGIDYSQEIVDRVKAML